MFRLHISEGNNPHGIHGLVIQRCRERTLLNGFTEDPVLILVHRLQNVLLFADFPVNSVVSVPGHAAYTDSLSFVARLEERISAAAQNMNHLMFIQNILLKIAEYPVITHSQDCRNMDKRLQKLGARHLVVQKKIIRCVNIAGTVPVKLR